MGHSSIDNIFNQNIEKYFTCCFSGHRPQKLFFAFSENNERFIDLRSRLELEIIAAINKGYKTFISGGGLGTDLLAAEIVVELRKEYEHIRLEFALPCKNHFIVWNNNEIKVFMDLKEKADKIIYVTEGDYYKGCMLARNKYLVDRSSLLIAVYNGFSGGTKQTIEYAKKNFIEIRTIDL